MILIMCTMKIVMNMTTTRCKVMTTIKTVVRTSQEYSCDNAYIIFQSWWFLSISLLPLLCLQKWDAELLCRWHGVVWARLHARRHSTRQWRSRVSVGRRPRYVQENCHSVSMGSLRGRSSVMWRFFPDIGPHALHRNANNVESYTFGTLFSRKFDTPTPPHLHYVTLERPLTSITYLYLPSLKWLHNI